MTAWRSANRCGSTYAARTYRRSAPSAVALTSERLTGLRAHGRIGPSLFTYALIATARSRLSSIGRIHSPRSLPMFDVLIKNALFFDGTGAPGVVRYLGIRDGKLACIIASVLDEQGCGQVIDAQNRWVTPGFIDMHTHYDAELVAAPALKESVRHGVTTVMIGSCSISMVLSGPEDCSDLFTRVESVPREHVLPLLQDRKSTRLNSSHS